MIERPIIALDFPSKKKLSFLEKFPKTEKLFVKSRYGNLLSRRTRNRQLVKRFRP